MRGGGVKEGGRDDEDCVTAGFLNKRWSWQCGMFRESRQPEVGGCCLWLLQDLSDCGRVGVSLYVAIWRHTRI